MQQDNDQPTDSTSSSNRKRPEGSPLDLDASRSRRFGDSRTGLPPKDRLKLDRPRRLGVLPRRSVRTAAFGIISLSIFACGALCLLAVWDYASEGVPWRALSSLGIVAGTMGAFAFVNELFGEAERSDAASAPAGVV